MADVAAESWRKDRIRSALRGENPTVVRRLTRGFAVMGDTQFLPGYCVLLVDDPSVMRLSDMPRPLRLDYLADLEHVGAGDIRVGAQQGVNRGLVALCNAI